MQQPESSAKAVPIVQVPLRVFRVIALNGHGFAITLTLDLSRAARVAHALEAALAMHQASADSRLE
jgi:hypothetical protein